MPLPFGFESYRTAYPHAALTRRDGILQVRFHTDGESLVWTKAVHDELPHLFADIGRDRENAAVILTGTGDEYCGALDHSTFESRRPAEWDEIWSDGQLLLENLLAVNVPIISAVNGPARFHSEIPVMSDIVLAADTAVFQDLHYRNDTVPGDGTHVVWTHLLGPNRGRYFLMMGQEIDALTAQELGVVAEVLEADLLLARAWEIAVDLARKPFLVRRYARNVLTQEYRRLMAGGVGYGLALQGLAKTDRSWPDPA